MSSADIAHQIQNVRKAFYDKRFHGHPDVAPKGLSDSDIELIFHYTKAGYGDMNRYLRNRAGLSSDKIKNTDSEQDIHDKIIKMWSIFTEKNTNKKDIAVMSGISEEAAAFIRTKKRGTFAGFTSMSSSLSTVESFDDLHAEGDQYRAIKAVVKPGCALSVAAISPQSENEVILAAGSRFEYTGSDSLPMRSGSGNMEVLNVIVTKGKTSFDDYGAYK